MADAATYRAFLRRRRLIVVGLLAILLIAFAGDLLVGPSSLTIGDAIRALFGADDVSRANAYIVWQVRLPQALTAILVGGALSLAGAEMQTILDNPLASPFTLGVSSAGAFGAALALLVGFEIAGIPSNWMVSASAFICAFASALLLQAVALRRDAGSGLLVLFGIALVFTFQALVALLQFVASEAALQQFVFWTMGSISQTNWEKTMILAIALLAIFPLSFAQRWKLTALRLGEDRARSFGISVRHVRFMSLFRISVLSGLAVAFVGTIGFVGLVGPHIARLLIGEDHRFFLPASLLVGAAVMSLSSIASKMAVPGVLLPIGIVTSLVGIPIFLSLVFGNRRRKAA